MSGKSTRQAMKVHILASLITALPTAAFAECALFTGTADGWSKEDASEGALNALKGSIDGWKAKSKVRAVSVTAMKPTPQPYWRSGVADHLLLHPDIVTGGSHTVCWTGVVSPVVCTSGAKVCW
jgi:hypothetical protein